MTTAALPFIVAATFFMEYLDTTIVATALPQMARSFSVGPNEVSLGMTAYMLTLAVFIPVSGWIADRFGSRTVFGGALVVFTVASILCGLSTGLGFFTAARVLQGIGGAMMVPVGRMIVVRNTDKSRLMKAISTITWPAIVAPVVGPTVGGFITTYASWHWVFFLNVPFGLAALAAIAKYVPNQREGLRRRMDFGLSAFQSGLLLLATAIGNLGMKVFTTRILKRFGFRTVSMITSAIAAVFVAGYGWLFPSTPLAVMVAVLFVYGLARSLQFTTLATLAYADVDDRQKAPASTLWSVAQQMTMGMGIAFGALCLRISAALGTAPRLHSQAFVLGDFRWAFIAAGGLIAVSIVGYARLPADAGNALAARG